MHDLNRFADIETTPVPASEGVGTGHLAYEFTQVDIAVFEFDLLDGVALARIAGITENLGINCPDHGLRGSFCPSDAGLATAARYRVAAGRDLLQPYHLGAHPAGAGLAELNTIHLAGLA